MRQGMWTSTRARVLEAGRLAGLEALALAGGLKSGKRQSDNAGRTGPVNTEGLRGL